MLKYTQERFDMSGPASWFQSEMTAWHTSPLSISFRPVVTEFFQHAVIWRLSPSSNNSQSNTSLRAAAEEMSLLKTAVPQAHSGRPLYARQHCHKGESKSKMKLSP
jgi:hypothetical protein